MKKITCVGRLPVVDSETNVYGYELLFKESDVVDVESEESSPLVVTTLLDITFDKIVGKAKALVYLEPQYHRVLFDLPLDPEQVILEIMHDSTIDDSLLSFLAELRSKGYSLAIKQFKKGDTLSDNLRPLISLVRIETASFEVGELESTVHSLLDTNIDVLAEGVDTNDTFELLKSTGCSLFQGSYFTKPKQIKASKIAQNKSALLQLLSRLQNPACTVEEVEEAILQDVALSYKILKYVNSSQFNLSNTIESIKQAIVLLGLGTVKKWVIIISLTSMSKSPTALLEVALIRSRFIEQITNTLKISDSSTAMMIGLFSVIDVIMELPIDTILGELPLSKNVTSAIIEYEGELGVLLKAIIEYEKGEYNALTHFLDGSISSDTIWTLYIDSVLWANELLAATI